MEIAIKRYTKDRIPDVVDFEKRLRMEESDWGWEIDDAYVFAVEKSFYKNVPDSKMRDIGIWIDIS